MKRRRGLGSSTVAHQTAAEAYGNHAMDRAHDSVAATTAKRCTAAYEHLIDAIRDYGRESAHRQGTKSKSAVSTGAVAHAESFFKKHCVR